MRKLALVALLLAPASAAAQSTGTPVFAAPYRAIERSELGVSLSDPGAGLAVEGFYKAAKGKWDIGFRAGFQDNNGGDTPILLGIDGRSKLVQHSESFPLDGALTVGVGANLYDGGNLMLIPIGISLGRRVQLEGDNVSFVPYFHPVLTPIFGGGDSDLLFSVGLGADVKVGGNVDLRISGALGDYSGIGFSAAWLH